eukprot:GHVU01120118.1.p1 GENE.GHVU01120118.1~~GHVU01120118.1.p1  ORF type:complete len:175 (+),score=22.77 GHVU01120118.1:857-1381(+)
MAPRIVTKNRIVTRTGGKIGTATPGIESGRRVSRQPPRPRGTVTTATVVPIATVAEAPATTIGAPETVTAMVPVITEPASRESELMKVIEELTARQEAMERTQKALKESMTPSRVVTDLTEEQSTVVTGDTRGTSNKRPPLTRLEKGAPVLDQFTGGPLEAAPYIWLNKAMEEA